MLLQTVQYIIIIYIITSFYIKFEIAVTCNTCCYSNTSRSLARQDVGSHHCLVGRLCSILVMLNYIMQRMCLHSELYNRMVEGYVCMCC